MMINVFALRWSSSLLFLGHVMQVISGYKILLVPPNVYFNSLTMELLAAGQELAERGHDVYIIIADKNIEGSFLQHLPTTIMPLKYRLT